MNVCDMCRVTPIEEIFINASFLHLKKDGEKFKGTTFPDTNSRYSLHRKICPDCFKIILKLIDKKGGEKK